MAPCPEPLFPETSACQGGLCVDGTHNGTGLCQCLEGMIPFGDFVDPGEACFNVTAIRCLWSVTATGELGALAFTLYFSKHLFASKSQISLLEMMLPASAAALCIFDFALAVTKCVHPEQ